MIEKIMPYLSIIKAAAIVALVVGLFAFGYHTGAKHIQTKWDASEKLRAEAERDAVIQRVGENAAKAEAQAVIANTIRKGYQDEISRINASNTAVQLRIKARCNGSTVSSTAQSAIGSNADATAIVALPADVTGNLYALMKEADSVVASCRAAQGFIRQNGMD